MTTTQLNPPIPMHHVTKGAFTAFLLTDYSPEHSLLFTGFVESTGEIWTYSNKELRACKNITLGRTFDNKLPKELEGFYLPPWNPNDNEEITNAFLLGQRVERDKGHEQDVIYNSYLERCKVKKPTNSVIE